MLRTGVWLVSLVVTVAAGAADGPARPVRPVSPILEWSHAALERFDASWLHVKFAEGSDVRLVAAPTASGQRFAVVVADDRDGEVEVAVEVAVEVVNAIVADAVAMRRTFPGDRKKFLDWKARGEAASGRRGPNLALWFDVEVPGGRAALATAINALNAIPLVEIAHPAPISEPAVVIGASPVSHLGPQGSASSEGTPDFTHMQDYLFDTPVGLDAPSAWAMPGGRGAGMKFIDVEQGWVHGHEDFDPEALFYQGEHNNRGDHGTAVMGEVVGVDNGYGITGFASDALWGTVGYVISEWPELPHRFLEAAEQLDPGDVWLIEIQMFPPGRSATPMEWVQVNFDVIWTSSWALGVVCVEAGANGSQNLDDSSWGGVFDRDVRDSGAILVAAGTPTGRSAEGFTNYGSRMDANAWGSQIVTTGYGNLYNGGSRETEYTSTFGGTSGASPMVAGSALCLQGIATARLGSPLWPADLRALLHDTGIDYVGSRAIGPRPDLGAAVEQLLSQGCPEDIDRSGAVGFGDVLALLATWGPCADCPEDLDLSGRVDFDDLLLVLAAWGPCPGSDVGACCLARSCMTIDEDACIVAGGVYQGSGTRCGVGCARPTDDCARAPEVSDGSYPFSTLDATTDGASLPPECDEGNGVRFRKDVWITYVASCDGAATASVCASDFDTRLAVYASGDCSGTPIACNDDGCGDGGARSEVSFPVAAGARYLVRIGASAGVGEGVLEIDCAGGG